MEDAASRKKQRKVMIRGVQLSLILAGYSELVSKPDQLKKAFGT
jgi:hypothetical protein